MARTLEDIYQILEQIRSTLGAVSSDIIDARRIAVQEGLSDIDVALGLIRAGEFRAGNANDPGEGFSGVRIAYPAMVYDGEDWHVAGCDNDVLQFGLRASDGAALFGGGVGVIDQEGLKMVDGSGNPVFTVLTKNTTINGESLGQGDVLIGDNGTSQPNILWDDSEGDFLTRDGLVVAGEIAGGVVRGYGVSVLGKGSGTTNDIPNTTNTTIDFDHDTNAERYDDGDFFDPNNSDRITIPTGLGGIYLIMAGGEWETTWSGVGEFFISINGVEPFSPLNATDASVSGAQIGNVHRSVHERELDAGDVIRLRVRQDSGSNKEFRFATFSLRKMR